ncbi:MAG TPA: CmcJ/NvfI family oxidoreductase [Acidimicrobiales bacterium]|nr:CmcJ/NvfI family oxidoreductase [Acidimicrobiales bacterium]
MTATTAGVWCEARFSYAGGTEAVPLVMPVLDGRAVPKADLPFDECGFELISHRSEAVSDWTDHAAIEHAGAEEYAAFARAFTGCDAAAVTPTILRNPATATRVADYAPILSVHSDFTDDYRAMVTEPGRPYQAFLGRVLGRYGLTIDDVRSASRLMVLQLWKNVGPTRPDHPLAFCDARDVADPDRPVAILIPEYGGERLDFQAYVFRPPAEGRADHWYTFPGMGVDEAVVFRTYDSARAEAGLPFFTPHSAFRDPAVAATPENRRASVEMRSLCIWR